MHGLHFVWAFLMFGGGLLVGFLGNQIGFLPGIVSASAGSAIIYLLLIATADFVNSAENLPTCECGKSGESRFNVDLGDDGQIYYVCVCGRRYFIEYRTFFRRRDDGSKETIAHRTWYGRWIPNATQPPPE